MRQVPAVARAAGWPGLFNSTSMHRVTSGNEDALQTASGQTYGLSECGVACLPPPQVETGRHWCPTCWPNGPTVSGSGPDPRPGPEPDPRKPVVSPKSHPDNSWFTR